MVQAKVLVIHLKNESAESVINKVKRLNEKSGPFECIFFLGDLLSKLDQVDISTLPPIYCFTSLPDSPVNGSDEVQANLTRLNGYGVYQMTNKLRIGYIALEEAKCNELKDKILEKFKLVNAPIDILITREWSTHIAELKDRLSGSDTIDDVAKLLQPRYHFTYSDNDTFFELNPFLWNEKESVSRFINLATYGSGSKWAYAFNIKIETDDDIEDEHESNLPTNLISNPYSTTNIKKRPMDLIDTDGQQVTKSSISLKKPRKVLPIDCHFCFTNPNMEDHMIISIDDSAYMTTAKGPLTVPKGDMNFPGHCLIIPIEHIPKFNNVDGQSPFETPLGKDLLAYERSVVNMNYQKFDMSTIVFEINSERSIHFHKQVFPCLLYTSRCV